MRHAEPALPMGLDFDVDVDSESPPRTDDTPLRSPACPRPISLSDFVYRFADDGPPATTRPRPKKPVQTCGTCRIRKVRCNGSRPVCSNCQRLGFPCSYSDGQSELRTTSLPRRRVRQACLSCHGRKARCSGHWPMCERCRSHGLNCVYRPGKRARVSASTSCATPKSPSPPEWATFPADGAEADHGDPILPSKSNHFSSGSSVVSLGDVMPRVLDNFFRHVHHIPTCSFLHRASLMTQYADGKVGRALLLALVAITSCLTDMGPGLCEFGHRCAKDAEALVFADYTCPSVFKIQALVLIIKYRILTNSFSSAFMLSGIASRFAAALRLNHESSDVCFLAHESRRRLMWSLFCIDAAVSGGQRDYRLWTAETLHIGLPCNERNFEFDLPQHTEKLVCSSQAAPVQSAEDVGSLALHIRILHIRQKIVEFSKDSLAAVHMDGSDFEACVLALNRELDDFAKRLPASFRFSEKSLRLRAYSPRICVFVMIHVWWHQCHCDLYRLGLAGFHHALPDATLASLDETFLQHCRQQCLDHALAMAGIFAAMRQLNATMVADLDLALCAHQGARILAHALHADEGELGLETGHVTEQVRLCLWAVEQCCRGPSAEAVAAEVGALIRRGLMLEDCSARHSRAGSTNDEQTSLHADVCAGGGDGAALGATASEARQVAAQASPWTAYMESPSDAVQVGGGAAYVLDEDLGLFTPPETGTEGNDAGGDDWTWPDFLKLTGS